MSDFVSITHDEHVAIVEVHRPPANYFDVDVLTSLADIGSQLAEDARTRAIVLCSEGKHFCAGANFSSGGLGDERVAESRRIYGAAQRMFTIGVPVVAAVQGSAVGGGLGLACSADFRVAAPSSRFHANFSSLGFHQGFGLSVSLPRIVGEQAASRLLLMSERLTGDQAAAIGLADVVVPDADDSNAAVRQGALSLARTIAQRAPLAVSSIRTTMRGDLAERVRDVLEHEIAEQARLWQTADCSEGIAANLERRVAVFAAR
ncbi:MAG: enoyl-CoA hydratase/isomerase family protein [Actinomycetota bacterium]|nr:enoyl-CoA hydratase/isomerase family protein [Actinomycetota bacterium]